MDAATLFDIYEFLRKLVRQRAEPSDVRARVRARVAERYEKLFADCPGDPGDVIADDLVGIDDELVATRRRRKASANYLAALEILQEETRRYLHALDHGRFGVVYAFLGLMPEAERERRVERTMRRALRAEREDLATAVASAVRGLLPEFAKKTADETVRTLRGTPQRSSTAPH